MYKSLIFVFIVFSNSLLAQVRLTKPEMYLGVSGGATASMVRFYPAVKETFLQGYNGGLIFRYIAEKNVGLQAEINFSQRGWKETSGLFTKQLNYIEFPFLTHIYIGQKNRFFINIGPKISYLISERNLVDANSGGTEIQQISPIHYPFDYGLCGGLGILFNVNKNILQLDSRAYFGLSDIYPNSKSDYFSNSNHINIAVNLAWLIQVK